MRSAVKLVLLFRKGGAYLIQDEFTTSRSAGAVNGTAAEPGPGTRFVTDTNGKLSVSAGGKLVTVTGGVGQGDPGLWYEPRSRNAGLLVIVSFTFDAAQGFNFGFDTNQVGALRYSINANATALRVTGNQGGAQVTVGALVAATAYIVAIALRSTGLMAFIKGGAFTNWVLIWIDATESTSPVYPAVGANGTTNAWSVDYIRMPRDLWLPIPLASDGFGSAFGATDGQGHAEGVAGELGAGGGGVAWTHNTYSVSGGKAINTPGAGSELITNPEFTTNTSGWTNVNSATVTRRDFASSPAISPTGGSDNFGVEVMSGGTISSAASLSPALTVTVGTWYLFRARVYTPSGNTTANAGALLINGAAFTLVATTVNDAWTTISVAGRFTSTTGDFRLRCNSAVSGDKAYFDAVSVKALTTADLFASVTVAAADVIASVDATVPAGLVGGLLLCWDGSNNYVIIYVDRTGGVVTAVKYVAGVPTQLFSTAITYSAGARLRVAKITSGGTATIRCYYNGAFVNSGTFTDAGLIANTKHGLFSVDPSNTFDNFTVYASGSGANEYSVLDNY